MYKRTVKRKNNNLEIVLLISVAVVVYLIIKNKNNTSLSLSSGTSRSSIQKPEPKVLYENEERIKLIRDSEGRVSEFIVHRTVTADG